MNKGYLNCCILRVFLLFFLFFACKSNETHTYQNQDNIILTLKSDEHVKIKAPETIAIKKGSKWKDVRIDVEKKVQIEDYFRIAYWHLENEKKQILVDSYKFQENQTIFAVSKPILYAAYTVKHFKQNIEDDAYTLELNEIKSGVVGSDTEALAKTYEGFGSKPFSQTKIRDDGTTVVRIDYDRRITSITLELAGGKTTTPLEVGKNGKNILKGKFGSKINLESPTKSGCFLKNGNLYYRQLFPLRMKRVYMWQNIVFQMMLFLSMGMSELM